MILATALATAIAVSTQPLVADDGIRTVGALERLSPALVLEAAKLIRTGTVYSLAITTGRDTPAFGHRNYQIVTDNIYVGDSPTVGANRLQGYDDLAVAWLGVGTQIDGFGHIALDGRHFGGVPSAEVIRPGGAIRFGIHTLPPIVGRGVLLDIAALRGVARLGDGEEIDTDGVREALAAQQIELAAGDVVLLHTGWLTMASEDGQRFLENSPGLTLDGARWLADQGVVAIGADLWALEPWPSNDGLPEQFLPAHGHLLVERGVHILENIDTRALAADRAWTFFFMLAAPRLEGALQSPVHPIAIR